jgi:site-specific recombinase XerD
MPPKHTKRAYETDVKAFRSFLNLKDEDPLPSDPSPAIVRYLLQLQSEGRSYSTIERRLYGISRAYVLRDEEPPAKNPYVRQTISNIRNSGDVDIERHGKRPITETGARAIVVALGEQLVDHRDRAIIALTFAGGLKRGQLAHLSVDDVEFAGESLIVHINRQRELIAGDSGRDQRTIDRYPEHLLDPADAVRCWLERAGIADDHGPLLRRIDRHGNLQEKGLSAEAIGYVVQRCVAAAGLKGVDYKNIGTESLRLGLVVTLSSRGVDVAKIAKRTGHHETVHLNPLIASAKRAGARKVDQQVVFVD